MNTLPDAYADKNRDWGLQELGRGFKNGVMNVKSSKSKRGKDAGPVRSKKGGGKGGKKAKRKQKLPI